MLDVLLLCNLVKVRDILFYSLGSPVYAVLSELCDDKDCKSRVELKDSWPFFLLFKLWDAGSGSLLQDLQADQPVLDICPFDVNHNSYLATLTEKTVHVYRWE